MKIRKLATAVAAAGAITGGAAALSGCGPLFPISTGTLSTAAVYGWGSMQTGDQLCYDWADYYDQEWRDCPRWVRDIRP